MSAIDDAVAELQASRADLGAAEERVQYWIDAKAQADDELTAAAEAKDAARARWHQANATWSELADTVSREAAL